MEITYHHSQCILRPGNERFSLGCLSSQQSTGHIFNPAAHQSGLHLQVSHCCARVSPRESANSLACFGPALEWLSVPFFKLLGVDIVVAATSEKELISHGQSASKTYLAFALFGWRQCLFRGSNVRITRADNLQPQRRARPDDRIQVLSNQNMKVCTIVLCASGHQSSSTENLYNHCCTTAKTNSDPQLACVSA